jgi:hypothetical protein
MISTAKEVLEQYIPQKEAKYFVIGWSDKNAGILSSVMDEFTAFRYKKILEDTGEFRGLKVMPNTPFTIDVVSDILQARMDRKYKK